MSQSAYALRQRRKLLMTRGVAGALVAALVAGLGLAASALGTSDVDGAAVKNPSNTEVDAGPAKPSDILTASTSSQTLNAAISALVVAERFRFELRMKPIAADSKTAWLVTGEADVATNLEDPPRLHAQVALGSGETYSVISEQIRVGDALYTRDATNGVYQVGAPESSEDLGAVDPVTTILASLADLPSSQFHDAVSAPGTRTVVVAADGHSIEGDITKMRIVIDAGTDAIKSMSFQSKAMTSRVSVTDLGDPSIVIAPPAR